VGTPFEYSRLSTQRLADLQNETVELERRLSDARASLDRELAHFAAGPDAPPEAADDASGWAPDAAAYPHDSGYRDEPGYLGGPGYPADAGYPHDPEPASRYHGYEDAPPGHPGAGLRGGPADRTETLVSEGRRTAARRRVSRRAAMALALLVAAVTVTVVVLALSGGGASWPASVAVMQREAATACQNPDVKAEPSQVNFACARETRQILWVFALLTSGGNPAFRDPATGRAGLEPITPAQGGEVAWSLNLHHPYNPASPLDSLAVAARAINNIIGGATLTGSHGNPVVQPGLEGHPAKCAKYTGSAAVISRAGFPDLCARPVTSPGGQAALVADVFGRWIVGATPRQAQEAAVLFTNARNPGNPQVQLILKELRLARPAA
jgi:hypothetical protein